ncbi:hypothetical protein DL96DRAFT_1717652 [Flagelloscypha sp. PMI_526]|nr:hypothetical protein DL96DRAFT_1717652 [Flagelloscypha sp. PMI_526]
MTLLLLPHLRASTQTGFEAHFTLLYNVGLAYYRGGLLQECATVCEQEKSKMQKELGLRHPDTPTSMNNLARKYSDLGQHGDALKLERQVLELRIQILCEDHPSTFVSLYNLATTYSGLGQYSDALTLEKRVVALRRQTMGEEHTDTLRSMHNLACTYSDLGQHMEALKLGEQIILSSMNTVAGTYSDLGRHKDALELNERTLTLRRSVLGPDHMDTAVSSRSVEDLCNRMASEKRRRKLGKLKRLLNYFS